MLSVSSVLAPSVTGGGRNTSPLSQIAGIQAVFDLDATLSVSYSGSGQTWANLIASPDDGSAQTAYDFYLGADGSSSTDDPTFNGSANDPAAYWSFDGGDSFVIASGANTAFLNNLHKTTGGSQATIIIAMKSPSAYSTTGAWFSTCGTSDSDGLEMRITPAPTAQLLQRHSGSTGVSAPFSSTPSTNAINLMAFAFDYTGGSLKTALNASSFTTKTLSKGTTTADATRPFALGRVAAESDLLPNGSIMYGAYAFNKLLSDDDLSAVIDVLNSRHGRTYA